jgi:hypothetical protein
MALYERCWQSHHTTITVAYDGGIANGAHTIQSRLAYALDQVYYPARRSSPTLPSCAPRWREH